jgi:hypothetical protein
MKRLKACLAAAVLVSGAAHAYPIDVQVKTQGLDVEAEPKLLGDATVMRLINHEPFPIRCDVQFSNGPEIARTRKVTVKAGGDHIARFMPSRVVVRMRVVVECWPAEGEADQQ